jgi:hypothetical protein
MIFIENRITDMGVAIEHGSHFSEFAVLTFFLFTSDGRVDRSIHAVHVTIADIPFTDFGNDPLIKDRKTSGRRTPVGQFFTISPVVLKVVGNDFHFLLDHWTILLPHALTRWGAIRLYQSKLKASTRTVTGRKEWAG